MIVFIMLACERGDQATSDAPRPRRGARRGARRRVSGGHDGDHMVGRGAARGVERETTLVKVRASDACFDVTVARDRAYLSPRPAVEPRRFSATALPLRGSRNP